MPVDPAGIGLGMVSDPEGTARLGFYFLKLKFHKTRPISGQTGKPSVDFKR